MRIIATTQSENALLVEIAKELREKGIYPDITNYEDGFGITVWSIDDLSGFAVTQDWSREEKIKFMEYADHNIGGATEDNWEIIKVQLDQYIDWRTRENNEYIDENSAEFEKTKFYLDVCGGGWVRAVYYNPDSNAGGQLVYDLLSAHVIVAAGERSTTEDEFWNCLYEDAKQTLVDINMTGFLVSAKEFVESPCDLTDQSADTMEKLKQWAKSSLKGA